MINAFKSLKFKKISPKTQVNGGPLKQKLYKLMFCGSGFTSFRLIFTVTEVMDSAKTSEGMDIMKC